MRKNKAKTAEKMPLSSTSQKPSDKDTWPDKTTAMRGVAAYLCAAIIAAICTYYTIKSGMRGLKIAEVNPPIAQEAKKNAYTNFGFAAIAGIASTFCFFVAGAGFRFERKNRKTKNT
jgi:hypothetical protein